MVTTTEWLQQLIESEKLCTIQFEETLQIGSFDSGTVKIDPLLKNPNQRSVYYRGKPKGWPIAIGKHHYFTGEGVLAHELFGHGLEWIEGGLGSPYELSKEERRRLEIRAIGRANTVRNLLGIPQRYE